jgi:hypothetical protein
MSTLAQRLAEVVSRGTSRQQSRRMGLILAGGFIIWGIVVLSFVEWLLGHFTH